MNPKSLGAIEIEAHLIAGVEFPKLFLIEHLHPKGTRFEKFHVSGFSGLNGTYMYIEID